MASHPSLSLVISFFLFFAILHTLPLGLTSRKLLDLTPNSGGVTSPTTPDNDVHYTSQTKGGAHGGVVSVNGHTKSEFGSVNDNDGNRKVDATSHDGHQNGVIKGNGGKPAVNADHTTDSETGTISGSNGQPKIEGHTYRNGTSGVIFYDENGKPVYELNSPYNSAGTTGYSYIPPIPQYPNSPPTIPQYPNSPPTIPQYPNPGYSYIPPIPQYPNSPPTIPQYPNPGYSYIPPIPQYPNSPPTIP